MKLRLVPLTEEEIEALPFPDTARAIGGLLILENEGLENHLNVEKFRQLWNEMWGKPSTEEKQVCQNNTQQ